MVREQTINIYIVDGKLDMQKIIDDYYNYISTIIRNATIISLEDEEEIMSDVFLIIWKNQYKLDIEANFSPYIAGITKRVVYRKYNELRKTIQILENEAEIADLFNVEKIIEQKEIDDLIGKQLKEIGQTEYEIFTKFYYEGKKVKEIAKELKLTIANVKTKLHRTREKMKKILKLGGFGNE